MDKSSIDRQSDKIDRRKRRSDAAIRKAFDELLEEKPLDKITVKELAERADIDRKTFYLRYDSIDDLVDSRIQEEAEYVAKVLHKAIKNESGEIDVKALYETLSMELLIRLNGHLGLLGHGNTDRLTAKLLPALSRALSEDDTLSLSENLGAYFNLFAAYFCGGLLSLYNQWMKTESELPLDVLAELASAAMTGGLVSLSSAAMRLIEGGQLPPSKAK
ncbi:MAG: TetR/AcrR family transcriptional regulator [Eggerthellaceae bacterium]